MTTPRTAQPKTRLDAMCDLDDILDLLVSLGATEDQVLEAVYSAFDGSRGDS